MSWKDEFDGLIVTFEQTKIELEQIEAKLAELHKISGNVRQELHELVKRNDFEETELVQDWLCACTILHVF